MSVLKRCLPLLLLLLAAAPASAQDESKVEWTVNGSLRVRGFYLGNGTLANQLDPTTRQALLLAGDEDIDATQTFLDTRLRLQLKATVLNEVSAFLAIEVGDITFGSSAGGGGLGTDGVIFQNKNLYLEWHPTQYSFRVLAGLYPRQTDPYGIVLSDDVAGVRAEAELLGLDTTLYADFIKAVENSRQDLDGDGVIDNDYNDRTVMIFGAVNTSIPKLPLEMFFIADIDDTRDTPVANTEQDTYWLGVNARSKLGPTLLSATWIGAYGKRTVTGSPGTTIRGMALDTRVKVELPFVTVEGIFAWASGTDPSRRTTDTGFPTIAPFYGASSIIYSNFGGFNVTGSSLSGTTHVTLVLRASPIKNLELEGAVLYAWYTSDRDVSNNVQEFNDDARDIGLEVDINATYTIVDGFKVLARGAIFFPGNGYQVNRDTRRGGPLSQIILGAQFDF